jgi:hypothetical protein
MLKSKVECPIDGCDYSGDIDSVEGHISGSRDDGHSGKVGQNYRSELREALAEKNSEEESTLDMTNAESNLATALDQSEAEEQTDSSASNDINSSRALLAATLLFVAVVLFDRVMSDDRDRDQDQDRESEDRENNLDGGLIQ